MKKIFSCYKILFATADGMAPLAVSIILIFFIEMKIPSAPLKLGHGNICILIKSSTGRYPVASRMTARCTLSFKVQNDLVAVDEDLRRPASRSLRSALQAKLQHSRSRTEAHHHSFFPRTIRDWNKSLSSTARKATNLDDFKAALQ